MTLRPSIIWYNHLHQTLLVTCLGQHESRTLVRAILPIQWSRERSLKPDCLALNGVSWASLVAQMVKNPTAVQETWVRSLGWEDPLEEGTATHSSILAWRIPVDRGAWWQVHGIAKSRTRLSNFTFTFHFHALEKEMATHSSVLAWRIPGMGEPGGLPSMGSHRVRHD